MPALPPRNNPHSPLSLVPTLPFSTPLFGKPDFSSLLSPNGAGSSTQRQTTFRKVDALYTRRPAFKICCLDKGLNSLGGLGGHKRADEENDGI